MDAVSGHLENYGDMMYAPMALDELPYRVKPMNCPGHVLIYKDRARSCFPVSTSKGLSAYSASSVNPCNASSCPGYRGLRSLPPRLSPRLQTAHRPSRSDRARPCRPSPPPSRWRLEGPACPAARDTGARRARRTECEHGRRFASAESMRRDEALHEERRGVLRTPRPPAEGGAGAATPRLSALETL